MQVISEFLSAFMEYVNVFGEEYVHLKIIQHALKSPEVLSRTQQSCILELLKKYGR